MLKMLILKNYSYLSTKIYFFARDLSLSLLIVIFYINPVFAKVKNLEIIEAIPDRNEGKVTLRVKVYDQKNKPIRGMQKNEFNLTVCPPKADPKTGECQTLNH